MCEQACTVLTLGQKNRNSNETNTDREEEREKNIPKAMADTSRSTSLGFSKKKKHICPLACLLSKALDL